MTSLKTSIYLVHVVATEHGVKQRVEVIEQVDHLDGVAEGGDGGETHNVAEIDGHLVEILRLHRAAGLESLGHRSAADMAMSRGVQLRTGLLVRTHGGSISDSSFSVLCFSASNSSVLSLIRSSRLELYCSNILSMESMMLVFLPLLINLNCPEDHVQL